jgi:hypothetical protein
VKQGYVVPKALTDAAVVYGAQRYFDGLHCRKDWAYRDNYKEDDDRLLFLEFLHNIILYDSVLLDNSSIEEEVSEGLKRFIEIVNVTIGGEWIKVENFGEKAQVNVDSARHAFCLLLREVLSRDSQAENRIKSVTIPWAYKENWHHDRSEFVRKFQQFDIKLDFLPFAIFAWRAMTYGAIAQYKSKVEKSRMAYVAAPGRLNALRAIMNKTDVVRYGLPRELTRQLEWGLPQFPQSGFDFTYITSLPFFEVSPVALSLGDLPPAEALSRVCSSYHSVEFAGLREDWDDVLFNVSSYSAVGNINIQIMKNVTTRGSVTQTQTIKAVPAELESAYG